MTQNQTPSISLEETGGDLNLIHIAWKRISDLELSNAWFKTTHKDFQADMMTEFQNIPENIVAQIAFMQEIANHIETHIELVLLGPNDTYPAKKIKN